MYYVRGDEWSETIRALGPSLASRCVRYWPGAIPEQGEVLARELADPSEWTHEREWRLPLEPSEGGWRFEWDKVAFVLVPSEADYAWLAASMAELDPELGDDFRSIPYVVAGNAEYDELSTRITASGQIFAKKSRLRVKPQHTGLQLFPRHTGIQIFRTRDE